MEEQSVGVNYTLWGPLSWTSPVTPLLKYHTKEELQEEILTQRETDCIELWLRGLVYRTWAIAKMKLCEHTTALGLLEVNIFKEIMTSFVIDSIGRLNWNDNKIEFEEMISLAVEKGSNGEILVNDFFQAIHCNGKNGVWSQEEISWIYTIVHQTHRNLCRKTQTAFEEGGHGFDQHGAILPTDVVWKVFSSVVGTDCPELFKSTLDLRYASSTGPPSSKLLKLEFILKALEIPITPIDIWLIRRQIATITHRCARALFSDVQSLPFPPRCINGIVTRSPSSSPTNVSVPHRTFESLQSFKLTLAQRMYNNPLITNACSADVLSNPKYFNLSHGQKQKDLVSKIISACREVDLNGNGHCTTLEFQAVILRIFAHVISDYSLSVLSMVYNTSSDKLMINYEALMKDIDLDEIPFGSSSACATSSSGQPMNETLNLIIFLYRKWVNKGHPSLLKDNRPKTISSVDLPELIKSELGTNLSDYHSVLLSWQLTTPSPHPPRDFVTLLDNPPDSGRKLYEAICRPQPLLVSLKRAQKMFEEIELHLSKVLPGLYC